MSGVINGNIAALIDGLGCQNNGFSMTDQIFNHIVEIILFPFRNPADTIAFQHKGVIGFGSHPQDFCTDTGNQLENKNMRIHPVIENGLCVRGGGTDILNDAPVVNHTDFRIIDAAEGIIAFGIHFPGTGADQYLASEHHHYPSGVGITGVAKRIQQIHLGVSHLCLDGFLGAGNDNGLGTVLDQIGKG